MSRSRNGFTLVEMLIAMIILSVGLLGLASTAALVTRMIGQGQRSAVAATFAASRMERLRPAACISSQRRAGADTLMRGGRWVAINSWSFADAGSQTYRVRVVTNSRTIKDHVRADTLEMAVPCQT
jgi:prepilin-type N-terminal cleavage/methylation domain-containing protein